MKMYARYLGTDQQLERGSTGTLWKMFGNIQKSRGDEKGRALTVYKKLEIISCPCTQHTLKKVEKN